MVVQRGVSPLRKLQDAGVLSYKQMVRGVLKWLPLQVTTKLIVV
jgi:hypothetical protein